LTKEKVDRLLRSRWLTAQRVRDNAFHLRSWILISLCALLGKHDLTGEALGSDAASV
jgi:hypothetical protein